MNTHLGKRKKAVKECLLDQSAIAGIGNIDSDEILFAAGIYPARPANSLNMEHFAVLWLAAGEVFTALSARGINFLLRLGYEFSDDTAIKNFFETGLKKDAQLCGWYHWLILDHCISVCKKSPNCDKCKFREQCKYSLPKAK